MSHSQQLAQVIGGPDHYHQDQRPAVLGMGGA